MKLRPGEWVVVASSGVIAAFAVLVGVLIYLKPPPVQFTYMESALAQAGEAIYRREGCNSCHRVSGNGGSYGPSLDGVGSRRTGEWLHRYLREPWPGVSAKPYRLQMPSYAALKDEELNVLVTYLLALRHAGQGGHAARSP